MRRKIKRLTGLLTIVASAFASSAFAGYPERSITLVVPSVPGGAADIVARVLADDMSKSLGQPVIVNNRPGTGGLVGTKFVSAAAPDGYTLILTFDTAMTIAPYLAEQLPYQPLKDFSPVGQIGTVQYMLVSSPNSGLDSVQTLVTKAKASPGQLSYASGGVGSNHHMAMESFQKMAGIQLQHIPYKAAPQGFSDVMGDHVSVMFIANGPGVPAASSGKVTALGAASKETSNGMQPLSNSVPGFSYESWFGLFAPLNTPSETIETLSDALRESLQKPDIGEKMIAAGVLPAWTNNNSLADRMASDTRAYEPLVARFKK